MILFHAEGAKNAEFPSTLDPHILCPRINISIEKMDILCPETDISIEKMDISVF